MFGLACNVTAIAILKVLDMSGETVNLKGFIVEFRTFRRVSDEIQCQGLKVW